MPFDPFKFIKKAAEVADVVKPDEPATKTTISVSNFNKNNTPNFLSKVGNICLIVAAIGGAAVLAPISSPVIAVIGSWAAFAGTVGKILTKMSGTEPVDQP